MPSEFNSYSKPSEYTISLSCPLSLLLSLSAVSSLSLTVSLSVLLSETVSLSEVIVLSKAVSLSFSESFTVSEATKLSVVELPSEIFSLSFPEFALLSLCFPLGLSVIDTVSLPHTLSLVLSFFLHAILKVNDKRKTTASTIILSVFFILYLTFGFSPRRILFCLLVRRKIFT